MGPGTDGAVNTTSIIEKKMVHASGERANERGAGRGDDDDDDDDDDDLPSLWSMQPRA